MRVCPSLAAWLAHFHHKPAVASSQRGTRAVVLKVFSCLAVLFMYCYRVSSLLGHQPQALRVMRSCKVVRPCNSSMVHPRVPAHHVSTWKTLMSRAFTFCTERPFCAQEVPFRRERMPSCLGHLGIILVLSSVALGGLAEICYTSWLLIVSSTSPPATCRPPMRST